jgi:mannose-6-phosphate isomerase-like protein (cupin superfamily)
MIRRIVTGTAEDGEATIISEGEPPRTHRFTHVPGFVNSMVWATESPATAGPDPTTARDSFLPRPGGTIAMLVTFSPDSIHADPGFDPAAAAAEQHQNLPGLAELFERENPGMHQTPTVDYCVVLSGDVVLDLDGETRTLHAGDIAVQNATRHAWRNPGTEPAVVFFVVIGTDQTA